MYYYFGAQESRDIGVAYEANEGEPLSIQLLRPDIGEVLDVVSFRLRDGGLADCLPCTASVPLCSMRLRDFMSALTSPMDAIRWMPAEVMTPSGVTSTYSLLITSAQPEVLDRSRTLWAGHGFVVRAVLDPAIAGKHEVFGLERASNRVIVSARAKKKLESAGFTGLMFNRV